MTRRTKILATLGPATDTQEKIEAIIAAGANVVRMNFSHGQAEDHIERAKRVRAAAAKLGLEPPTSWTNVNPLPLSEKPRCWACHMELPLTSMMEAAGPSAALDEGPEEAAMKSLR